MFIGRTNVVPENASFAKRAANSDVKWMTSQKTCCPGSAHSTIVEPTTLPAPKHAFRGSRKPVTREHSFSGIVNRAIQMAYYGRPSKKGVNQINSIRWVFSYFPSTRSRVGHKLCILKVARYVPIWRHWPCTQRLPAAAPKALSKEQPTCGSTRTDCSP